MIYGIGDGGADLGITPLDMPPTPETVWRAIRDPKSRDPTGLKGDLDQGLFCRSLVLSRPDQG